MMNLGNTDIAIFNIEVSPFVGLNSWDSQSQQKLYDFLTIGRSVSTLIADKFELSSNWDLLSSLDLYQMVCLNPIPFKGNQTEIQPLSETHIPAMLELTALTKPGPFMQRTIDFGNYYGIFEKGDLVAMAGERLHLPNFTEISAVCTHPSHLGKGYAGQLIHHISKQIRQSGKQAFLHVRKYNDRAISLYQGLGFEIRKEIYFAAIKPKK